MLLEEIKARKYLRALFIMGMFFVVMSFIMVIELVDPIYPIYFMLLGFGILICTFLYMIVFMMTEN